jgi:hypothetical protein
LRAAGNGKVKGPRSASILLHGRKAAGLSREIATGKERKGDRRECEEWKQREKKHLQPKRLPLEYEAAEVSPDEDANNDVAVVVHGEPVNWTC